MTLEEKIDQVPDRPGVYLYKDAKAQIVYIGKAASLRSRVRSYFQESRARDPKTDALVGQIRDLEYIVTANELEAMILESTLVKKHRPRYNIILRDDKHYPFLKLTTNEDFPCARAVSRSTGRSRARVCSTTFTAAMPPARAGRPRKATPGRSETWSASSRARTTTSRPGSPGRWRPRPRR